MKKGWGWMWDFKQKWRDYFKGMNAMDCRWWLLNFQKELSWCGMCWAHGEGGVFKSWVGEWAVVCSWWLA